MLARYLQEGIMITKRIVKFTQIEGYGKLASLIGTAKYFSFLEQSLDSLLFQDKRGTNFNEPKQQ
jgi:hypothetical protein